MNFLIEHTNDKHPEISKEDLTKVFNYWVREGWVNNMVNVNYERYLKYLEVSKETGYECSPIEETARRLGISYHSVRNCVIYFSDILNKSSNK